MKRTNSEKLRCAPLGGALTAAIIAAFSMPAGHSQTLEEVVVTARKKEESLSTIPLSITAITEQEIENAGFENILDIAKATPGFVFESYNTFPGRYDSVPFIRGVVFDNLDPIRQTVSVFVDGIYVAGGTQGIGVEDVQRIEVIKGPQSAQFGRATFAGAVNYVTVDPADELQGKVSGSLATRDDYELTASVEGPLGGSNMWSGRLSGRYDFHGGHYPNDLQADQQLGEQETMSVGGMIMFQPNDAFSAKFRAFFSQLDDNHAAVYLHDSTLNSGPFGGAETIFAGTLPEVSNTGLNTTDADFQTWITQARAQGVNFIGGEPDEFGLERDSYRISLDASYEFANNITLTGIFGVNADEGTILLDVDYSPDNAFTSYAGRDFEDFSGELRIAGLALEERLDWGFGVSLYELDYRDNFAFGVPAFGQASSFGALGEVTLTEVTTEAVFGQIGFALTDQWTLNFEARYQRDEIDQKVEDMPNVSVAGSPGEFKKFLPRIIVDYAPTDDSLFYVSYSEGNLAGGFNGTFLNFTAAQQAEVQQQFPGLGANFDEETLESIEIGWKQTFSKGNLAVALYRMDRTDQVTTAIVRATNPLFGQPNEPEFISTTVRVNSAATEITGLEIEGNWYPTENLSMRGTLAYTSAEISAFPASGDSGDYEDVFGTNDGFIGRKAERYPPYQATLSATYEAPANFFGTDGSWFVRGDVFYADKYYLSTPNLGETPTATEVNLRGGFRNDRYTLEAFVTNLTEEEAPVSANNGSDLSNVTPLFVFGVEATNVGLRDKRQFGLRGSMKF